MLLSFKQFYNIWKVVMCLVSAFLLELFSYKKMSVKAISASYSKSTDLRFYK